MAALGLSSGWGSRQMEPQSGRTALPSCWTTHDCGAPDWGVCEAGLHLGMRTPSQCGGTRQGGRAEMCRAGCARGAVRTLADCVGGEGRESEGGGGQSQANRGSRGSRRVRPARCNQDKDSRTSSRNPTFQKWGRKRYPQWFTPEKSHE